MKTEREKRLEAALREARNAMTDIGGDLQCGAMTPKKAAGQLFEASSEVNAALSDEGSGGECPECGGLGLVSAVDWVEHYPVLAAEPCPVCSDPTPPQRREALEILEDVIDVLSEYAEDRETPYGPARNVTALAVQDLKKVRRALSEPTMSEAVRRLPNKIRKEVDEAFEDVGDDWAEAQKVIGHEIADELDRALAQHDQRGEDDG